MQIFGSITRLVSILFRKDNQDITLQPNAGTTYTAARVVSLPPGDTAHELSSATSSQTLTNKTISGASNTLSNISLTSAVTGVLPVANGGTNSSTALVSGRAMVSTAGAIVESTTTSTEVGYLSGVTSAIQTQLNGKQASLGFTPENVANKNQPSGYAGLDAGGKISASQLPSAVMEFQGNWNPNTNTPALADGTGNAGDVYWVSVARSAAVSGLTDASMVNFQVGDLVIYSSANSKWQLTTPAAGVQSVNGAQGAVTVNAINQLTGDVTAGPASGSASAAATIAAGAITDSKVSASAAIAVSKLAAGSNNQVLTVVAGVPTWSATQATTTSFKTNWVTADGTSKTVTHNLASADLIVQVIDAATGEYIMVNTMIQTSNNVLTLNASSAPSSSWRVLILAV
jgi:hypothetical protein